LEGPGFKSQHGDWLSSWGFVGFLGPFGLMPKKYLTLTHDHLLPYPFQRTVMN
jgi:hypothetical protein